MYKMENRADESPTIFAAKLILEGHTPDEVKHIMESRKMSYPTVSNVLDEFMSKKKLSVDALADMSGIDASGIRRIMNGQRNPSRNILLRIAMALSLSVEETQVLLKSGNCAPLSAARERDLIIMDAIIHGKKYDSVNELLMSKQMPVLKENFKYYAFISYSHKDKETAKELRTQLKSYHILPDLLKANPDLPEKFNVFMDESNLVAKGTLKKALHANLEKSKYLILICSPNSAKSEYVNDEVEYFIKTGRTDHIIPLIIDGVPHAKDKSLECFPSALLKLSRENELLGIDLKKFGQHDAFMRVIATLLGLDLDEFASGDVNVKTEDDNMKKRNALMFTLAVSALVILAGVFIWYNF